MSLSHSIRTLRHGLVAATLAGVAWGASAQVVNGGFESGALAPFAATVSGSSGTGVTTSDGGVTPHSGTYFAYGYDNAGEGYLSQTLSTVPGATYSVSVWVATSQTPPPNAARIGLGASTPVSCTLAATPAWTQCTANFTATTASDDVRLYFQTQGRSGVLAFDDVAVTLGGGGAVQQVPTLAQWALAALALMLGGLSWRRIRRG